MLIKNPYNTGDNDSYGTAVAASNTHMIIGAHNEDSATAPIRSNLCKRDNW